MEYVTAGSVEESIKRVKERSYRGGHSASEKLIREIYDKSTKNLIAALDFDTSCLEALRIYDNSRFDKPLQPLLYMRHGRPTYLSENASPWLGNLLQGTRFDITHLRESLKTNIPRKGRDQGR
jgi:predicted ABC-type ATPase